MSKYKEIKGFKVQTLASDTAASVIDSGVWSSAPNLNATIREGGGSGTSTSAINVGGYPYPMTSEQWNGSTWATFANMATPRGKNATAGTYTNAIVGNGSTPGTPGVGKLNLVESWNGSAWSEIAEINSIRDGNAMSAGGTNTAVIYFGGAAPGGVSALNESWNGSAWTEVADLNTARSYLTGMGTQTASLAVGGSTGTAVESWNGSSWSEVAEVNTSRNYAAGSSLSSTDGLVFGGNPALANTEAWNGSTWTEVNDLATGRNNLKGAGPSSTAALAFGGLTPSVTAATEEWTTTPAPTLTQINLGQVYYNSTANAFKVTGFAFPTGTWASNTASPTATTERWGTGLSNSDALIQSPPGVSMEWNGSSWTNGGTTNFNGQARGATGGISAALIWGGSPNNGETEQYNGTAWTEVADLNTTGNQQPAGPTGTYTNTITAGRGPGWQAVSESWNGSTWTETSDLNTARRALGSGGGSSTDAAVFGGNVPPNNASALTETWNGSAWTETTDLNTARFSGMGFGNSSQSVGYVAGGSYPALPPYNVKTEFFNGSTWTEVGDLANGRYHNKGGGTGASALTAGGYLASPAGGQSTENAIWTVDQDNLTITVS